MAEKTSAAVHTFAYRTFRGSSVSHQATLRLPPDVVRAPLVLNVHGGFWKTQWSLQNLSTGKLLAAFTGCATLDVEYARVDQNDPAASPEGGGPAATRRLRELPRISTGQRILTDPSGSELTCQN